MLDNPRFQSKEGKSHFQLWCEMIELLVSKAKDINTSARARINVDSIIRSGVERNLRIIVRGPSPGLITGKGPHDSNETDSYAKLYRTISTVQIRKADFGLTWPLIGLLRAILKWLETSLKRK